MQRLYEYVDSKKTALLSSLTFIRHYGDRTTKLPHVPEFRRGLVAVEARVHLGGHHDRLRVLGMDRRHALWTFAIAVIQLQV